MPGELGAINLVVSNLIDNEVAAARALVPAVAAVVEEELDAGSVRLVVVGKLIPAGALLGGAFHLLARNCSPALVSVLRESPVVHADAAYACRRLEVDGCRLQDVRLAREELLLILMPGPVLRLISREALSVGRGRLAVGMVAGVSAVRGVNVAVRSLVPALGYSLVRSAAPALLALGAVVSSRSGAV